MPQSPQDAYNEFASYTLSHAHQTYFIHQHVVDAFALETADEHTKPIKITFALVGLYLFLEKYFTGRQVQRAHMILGRHQKSWPTFPIPKEQSTIMIFDVLKEKPGTTEDAMIKKWCESMWDEWVESQSAIRDLVERELEM